MRWVLVPIALLQALWLRVSRPRLQEPEGERRGVLGQGPALSVLILGDSSAAGVGAAHQSDALLGQLTRRLARTRQVHFCLAARCGATTATTLRRLRAEVEGRWDVVVIAVGINDAKNGVPLERAVATYGQILAALPGQPLVLCNALPPVADFPTVPWPLRQVLGARAARFDAALEQMAQTHGAQWVRLDAAPTGDLMATDGMHPGPGAYDIWAEALAHRIEAAP